jgi:multisubunit Na+/H+ antiporter MnhG subunit
LGKIHRTTQEGLPAFILCLVIANFSKEELWIFTSWACQKINMAVMVYEVGPVSIHIVVRARYRVVHTTNNMIILEVRSNNKEMEMQISR